MSARWIWTLAAASLLACATTTSGPGAQVRLETPDVQWSAEGAYEIELAVYNASGRRITIARPTQETVELAVYPEDPNAKAICKSPRATTGFIEPSLAISLPTGGRAKFSVAAKPYCPQLKPGTYRYEARFVASPVRNEEPSWSGTIGPEQGKATVSDVVAPGAPAEGGDHAAEEAARACIDAELASRGLNAYGDPQGTTYPGGPPVQEDGRALYVAARLPELRTKCNIKGF